MTQRSTDHHLYATRKTKLPEGPEVKLFVDKLNEHYQNQTIKNISVLSGRYTKKPIPDLKSLVGLKFKSFNCKGKFIWFDLDDKVIFNTLGMTGSWNNLETKHTRIKITTNDDLILCFNDIRNFGTFHIKSKDELEKKLSSIGPDMLFNPPSSKDFVNILRKKNNKNICETLMNQNVISGVGNYIKAESLWYSRINPHALIKNLTDINLVTLRLAIIYVINKSYQEQGATIKSYYTFSGEEGSASEGFVVYGRKTDYNGHNVTKDQTPDNRTTHWVKSRQIIG